MKNKKFLSLILICLFTFVLASCSADKAHTHQMDTGWTTDENSHWHICVDPTCGETSDFGPHTWVASEGHPATCTEDGTITWTCSVCGRTKGPEKAFGHDWKEPVYAWAEDGSSCEAKIICNNCGEEISEMGKISSEVIQGHSCTPVQNKVVKFTATFKNPSFETQVKEIATIPGGHGEGEFAFNETEHWKICPYCDKEIEGTRVAHKFNDQGVCECGYVKTFSVTDAKEVRNSDAIITVKGVVLGAYTNYDGGYNFLILKDTESNEICAVRNRKSSEGGECKILGGTAYLAEMYFAIGDIIEIPLTVHVNTSMTGTQGGEHNRVYFKYYGDNFADAVTPELVESMTAKYRVGHLDNIDYDLSNVPTIDSQESLEKFCLDNTHHYQIVKIHGSKEAPLKFVSRVKSSSVGTNQLLRSYLPIFYDNASNDDEVKINYARPVFANFSSYNQLDGQMLSTILANQTEYVEDNYDKPFTFTGDIYCILAGGSTAYYHFVVLDAAHIVKA